MKDLKEILQEFEGIQELPVSEETIGAYLEGNLVGSELRDVHNLLNSDSGLSQIVNEIEDIDKSIDNFISPSQSGIETPSILNSFERIHEVPFGSGFPGEDFFTLDSGESLFDVDFGSLDVSTPHEKLSIGHSHDIAVDPNESNSFHHPKDDEIPLINNDKL